MPTGNGDTNNIFTVKKGANTVDFVRGLGSFHKTLPHNQFGEVDAAAFAALVSATRGNGMEFAQVPQGEPREITQISASKNADCKDEFSSLTDLRPAAAFTNPQAGLAHDRLTHDPSDYHMPPAPGVMSNTTAAEMLELYWMALLRDVSINDLNAANPDVALATDEINKFFKKSANGSFLTNQGKFEKNEQPNSDGPEDRFILGLDVPGGAASYEDFTPETIFRLGFPGDDIGPMISQFFLRPAPFGTQTIDQRQRPYKAGLDYLTSFDDWLKVQNSGLDGAGQSYGASNEDIESAANPDGRYEKDTRYIATMRDLARFVNKDALHQAYFNAALILLAGGAKWPIGNPYHDVGNGIVKGALPSREAGFGTLGGPHILALVSEVATRALKVVWNQKWQVNLRLRPEAYGGLMHVQNIGVKSGGKRDYGLPRWLDDTAAANRVVEANAARNGDEKTLLLPMAFTAGSPTHPAYGAGHATVAGACVTVLKAYFMTFTTNSDGSDEAIRFCTLTERDQPFGSKPGIKAFEPTLGEPTEEEIKEAAVQCCDTQTLYNRRLLDEKVANKLTIEGELNKLAQNVAMGRGMGGVHWRTDNTRSLILGEALAAEILAQISVDVNEHPSFTFRTFARRADGMPKKVLIENGKVFVDGVEKSIPCSAL